MKNKLKARLKGSFLNEKGSVSIYVLIFMIFFLPFVIWVGVQLPIKIESTYSVKQMVSNTADSIISRVDIEELAAGRIAVNMDEAKDVAKPMIQNTLNLDENNDPSGKGLLKENIPIEIVEGIWHLPQDENEEYMLPQEVGVYVYIVNNPTGSVMRIANLLPIERTSVIVQANIPIEDGGFMGGRTVIHKTGFSEAQLKAGKPSP